MSSKQIVALAATTLIGAVIVSISLQLLATPVSEAHDHDESPFSPVSEEMMPAEHHGLRTRNLDKAQLLKAIADAVESGKILQSDGKPFRLKKLSGVPRPPEGNLGIIAADSPGNQGILPTIVVNVWPAAPSTPEFNGMPAILVSDAAISIPPNADEGMIMKAVT